MVHYSIRGKWFLVTSGLFAESLRGRSARQQVYHGAKIVLILRTIALGRSYEWFVKVDANWTDVVVPIKQA